MSPIHKDRSYTFQKNDVCIDPSVTVSVADTTMMTLQIISGERYKFIPKQEGSVDIVARGGHTILIEILEIRMK